jgi:hypothetical protein
VETRDISGKIYDLYPNAFKDAPYLMYSFSKPSQRFWQGAYNYCIEQGCTHEEAMDVLQSKHPRWMFDNDDGRVDQLGHEMFKAHFRGEKPQV